METLNCMKCKYRHEDNGNCTAVGGFCTAVTAAHCPLLREYLDTGLTPEEVERSKLEIEAGCVKAIARMYGIDINRLRKFAEADRAGRVVVLPCKVGDTVYFVNAKQILEFAVVGYAVDETGISWVHSEHVDKIGNTNERTFSTDRFGKNTFFTSEEAEKAMKGETEK